MSCNCYSLAYNCGNVVYMDCFGRRFFDIEVENLKYSGSNVCIGLFSEVLTFQTGHPSAVLSLPVDFFWVNRTQEFLSKHNLRTDYLYFSNIPGSRTRTMEPDLIQNSQVHHNNIEEFGPKFKKLRITDNVRELQTVLRDKWVLPVI